MPALMSSESATSSCRHLAPAVATGTCYLVWIHQVAVRPSTHCRCAHRAHCSVRRFDKAACTAQSAALSPAMPERPPDLHACALREHCGSTTEAGRQQKRPCVQSDPCICACRCLYKPTKPFKEFLENVVAGRQRPAVLEEPEKVGCCLLRAGFPASACSDDAGVWRAGASAADQVGCCLLRTHAAAWFISTSCNALDGPVRRRQPAGGCAPVCSTVLGPGRQGPD